MPRKKTTKKSSTSSTSEPAGPAICSMPNCNEVCFPDSEYCGTHALIAHGFETAREGVAKAMEEGDWWGALKNFAFGAGIQRGAPIIDRMAKQAAAGPVGPIPGPIPPPSPPPPRPPPQPQKRDPFIFLGLDVKTATSKEVRAQQKKMCEIFHPDRRGKAGEEMTKDTNAAAAAALAYLKERGR